jgi:hypothetical protein
MAANQMEYGHIAQKACPHSFWGQQPHKAQNRNIGRDELKKVQEFFLQYVQKSDVENPRKIQRVGG